MDRKKIAIFLIFFFSLTAIVQHIQVQRERENWKKICVQLEIDKSYAALPLAVTVIPVVLSAIVTGSAIGWTQYNANGKQAWVKFTGAVRDGVQVTKQWLEEKIAENNNIDTSAPEDYDPSDGFVTSNGNKYTLGNYITTTHVVGALTSYTLNNMGTGVRWDTGPGVKLGSGSGAGTILVKAGQGTYSSTYHGYYTLYAQYILASTQPASAFDPANYPEIFTGSGLFANCQTVANQYPNIKPTYEFLTEEPPDSANATVQEIGGYMNGYIDVNGTKYDINSVLPSAQTLTASNGTVYNLSDYTTSGNYIEDSLGNKHYLSDLLTDSGGTITYSNGTTVNVRPYQTPTYVDNVGNILDSPPSEVANYLGLDISKLSFNDYSDKYIATGVATPDTKDDGRKLLPGWMDTRLKGAGIDLGAGSTIKGVSKDGRLEWTDSAGVTRTTLVDSTFAQALIGQGVAVRTTVNGVTTFTQAAATTTPEDLADPGNPSPPPMGSGEFDPSFDWGDEDEFDIDHWKGVLGSLPLVNLLKGSSLQISTTNPVLSIPLSSWPGGPVTLSIDFSQYETLFHLMGSIIYFFALIYSISLALLGRGL